MASSLGVVASGHPAVSAAAAEALGAGGSAVDAALAAGFAAAVAEPMFTSLGGGGFLLARSADGRAVVFDFFVDTPGRGLAEADREPHFLPVTVRFPSSEQVFHAGLGSVAVPGTLAGFLHVHGRLARLPLAELVSPAVRLARQGVVLNTHQAYVQGLLEPIVTLSAQGRAIYAPEGRGLREGEQLLNPALADFLEALPDHLGRDLYEGALAAEVARDMRAGQGLLTEADLAGYAVREREPLACRYRGHELLTNPAPSLGAPLIARTLALLEGRELAGRGSPQELCALAAAMAEVERLRTQPAAGGTTHVSVSDAAGNAASLSLSNGEGSGYLVPGTGIMLNNMLGEDDLHPEGFHASPAGQRVGSMMSPTIALTRAGAVRLVLGSGGSKRIRSAIVQVLGAVLDFGASVREAVEAPRIHWDGEVLQVEPGLDGQALEALAREWPLNPWSERNLYFGGVHAVDPRGEAAGDPRREGHGQVVR